MFDEAVSSRMRITLFSAPDVAAATLKPDSSSQTVCPPAEEIILSPALQVVPARIT